MAAMPEIERIEVVNPDDRGNLGLRCVEVLMPLPVIDDHQVALLPVDADVVDNAVPGSGHTIEPSFATVAMTRLVEPWRQLMHHRRQSAGAMSDGAVNKEATASAAWSHLERHVLVGREDSRLGQRRRLVVEPLDPAGVRVVAEHAAGSSRGSR